jgi:shikimate kinase
VTSTPDPVVSHLVITGPMGAGKTTVGRILADRLGWSFVDSDDQIETRFGMTGRTLAERHGVEHLHEAEARACSDALSGEPPVVVAVAASVADRPDLVGRFDHERVFVVFLEGDPAVLAARAGSGPHRRTLAPGERAALAGERRRTLAGVADLILDVTGIPPEEVADRITVAAYPDASRW